MTALAAAVVGLMLVLPLLLAAGVGPLERNIDGGLPVLVPVAQLAGGVVSPLPGWQPISRATATAWASPAERRPPARRSSQAGRFPSNCSWPWVWWRAAPPPSAARCACRESPGPAAHSPGGC